MIEGCVNQGWENSCGNMSWCFFGFIFLNRKKKKTKSQQNIKKCNPDVFGTSYWIYRWKFSHWWLYV
jgi:hypothetical protein